MERRSCGTGLSLPVLGLGVWAFGGGDYWGPQDQTEADAIIARALALGCNYFDTAEAYNDGGSEASLARALGNRRREAIIGSKVRPNFAAPEAMRAQCEASLRRLRTDYIDLYMIHWPVQERAAADAAFETLIRLKEEGKVRYAGLSNHGVRQMTDAQAAGVPITANQVIYSLLTRAIEFEILPFCRERKIGILAYMPLMQGLLTGKYRNADEVPYPRTRTRHFRPDRRDSRHGEPGCEAETFATIERIRQAADRAGIPMGRLALAWAAANPAITCVLAGTRSVEQLEENAAGASLKLPADLVADLDAITLPLREAMGPSADYFQHTNQSRVQ